MRKLTVLPQKEALWDFKRMQRWAGLGVIADNLINIGRYLVPRAA